MTTALRPPILRRLALRILDHAINAYGTDEAAVDEAVHLLTEGGMRPSRHTVALALEARAAFLKMACNPDSIHGPVLIRATATYDGCIDLLAASAL